MHNYKYNQYIIHVYVDAVNLSLSGVCLNTYATNIHCLVLLQKRIIRLICGAKRLDHTNLLFYNVHILKLPDLVKLKTAIISSYITNKCTKIVQNT